MPEWEHVLGSQSEETTAHLGSAARSDAWRHGDVPNQIGPYRLDPDTMPLKGGMGVVYKARNVAPLGGWVAVKVIQEAEVSPASLALFENEATKSNLVRHPNVVQVLFAGRFETPRGERPYYVMEWLQDSVALDDRRLLSGLSLRQRVELMVSVCEAVGAAHKAGVVHGDIKPGNVGVVDWRTHPTIKILDFGLARAMQGWRQETLPIAGGTARYMSPELAARHGRDPDEQSDIYALGVTMEDVFLPSWDTKSRQLVDGRLLRIMERATATTSPGLRRTRYERIADLEQDLRDWLNSKWVRGIIAWRKSAGSRPLFTLVAAALVVAVFAASAPIVVQSKSLPVALQKLLQRDSILVPTLNRTRVIALTDANAAKAFDAAKMTKEERESDAPLRIFWGKLARKLESSGARVTAWDLFFAPARAGDQELVECFKALEKSGTRVILGRPRWDDALWGGSSPSAALYETSGFDSGTCAAYRGVKPYMAYGGLVVSKPNMDPLPSMAILAAAAYQQPTARTRLRFSDDQLSVCIQHIDPRPGRAAQWKAGEQSVPAAVEIFGVEDADTGLSAEDRLIILPVNSASDESYTEFLTDAADVFVMTSEQLRSRFMDKAVVIGTSMGNADTMAKLGRPKDHGFFYNAVMIDVLINRAWPRPMGSFMHTAVVVGFTGLGLGVCVALRRVVHIFLDSGLATLGSIGVAVLVCVLGGMLAWITCAALTERADLFIHGFSPTLGVLAGSFVGLLFPVATSWSKHPTPLRRTTI